MTRKSTCNDSQRNGAASCALWTLLVAAWPDISKWVTIMDGEWITKSTRIGALLGGIAGFFYAAYITATSPGLGWIDAFDMAVSVVAVLVYAVILGGFCIAIGAVAGLALGVVSSPLSSVTKHAKILPFRVGWGHGEIEKRHRAS